MPTPYIDSLVKQGKGQRGDLESKWEKAVSLAEEEGKGDNYAYITGIFNRMIGKKKTSAFEKYLSLLRKQAIAVNTPNVIRGNPMGITQHDYSNQQEGYVVKENIYGDTDRISAAMGTQENRFPHGGDYWSDTDMSGDAPPKPPNKKAQDAVRETNKLNTEVGSAQQSQGTIGDVAEINALARLL